MHLSTVYESSDNFRPFVDEQVGDCSDIARGYAELMYGEEAVEENEARIEGVIEEYSDPFSGELSRPEFFENVKSELDELLSE